MSRILKCLPAWLFLLCFAPSSPVFSCPVCFGNPNSSMVHGARAGVIFLGGMIYLLLMGMVSVALYWMMRARKLAALEESSNQQQHGKSLPIA